MTRFASVIAIEANYIRSHEVWVLEHDGQIAGFYALVDRGETAELDHLWLAPVKIGKGFGRLLFDHAVQRARDCGARRLEWEAEPNATGFYQRMGGLAVRTTTSELGRTLHVFSLELQPC